MWPLFVSCRVDSPHGAEATFAANAAAVVRCGAMRCGQTPAAANPTFAKQAGVPLTRIEGRSACFASQKCRAKHRLMPLGPVGRGRKCFANVGLAITTLTASSVHQAVQAIGTHCPAQKRPTQKAGLLFVLRDCMVKGEQICKALSRACGSNRPDRIPKSWRPTGRSYAHTRLWP